MPIIFDHRGMRLPGDSVIVAYTDKDPRIARTVAVVRRQATIGNEHIAVFQLHHVGICIDILIAGLHDGIIIIFIGGAPCFSPVFALIYLDNAVAALCIVAVKRAENRTVF